MKKICNVCKGNGFLRVPYEQAREEQWANCEFCNSQGEIEENDQEQRIEELEKQKEYLQTMCRKAGAEIKDLKDTIKKLEKLAALTTDEILDRMRVGDKRPNLDYTEDKV